MVPVSEGRALHLPSIKHRGGVCTTLPSFPLAGTLLHSQKYRGAQMQMIVAMHVTGWGFQFIIQPRVWNRMGTILVTGQRGWWQRDLFMGPFVLQYWKERI